MKIVTGFLTTWRVASKTQPIKAKPLITLLVDRQVSSKFLVDTLEGKEPLGDGSIICIGAAGDAWQQTQKKLLAKYDVTEIDKDGWMVCTPKPDNAVNCIEASKEFLASLRGTNASVAYPDDRMYNMGDFAIEGQWGDAGYPQLGKNVQWGSAGDFVCQNRTDPTDVWVVRRKLFLNTYIQKS
jgi:hypothetical protein